MSAAEDYVVDVCRLGGGEECCRYLVAFPFTCAKLTVNATYIDERVASGTFAAKGDNCEGRPFGLDLASATAPALKPEPPKNSPGWGVFTMNAARGGFEVTCPCCRSIFTAVRPQRPFRVATLESLLGPPDVRFEPRHASARIAVCQHCGDEYRPARGTRSPRFCSKSCARRAVLLRKHGLGVARSVSSAGAGEASP